MMMMTYISFVYGYIHIIEIYFILIYFYCLKKRIFKNIKILLLIHKMFLKREKDHEVYENYNQDSTGCYCDTGCCAGIKSILNKIKSYRFKKVKTKK